MRKSTKDIVSGLAFFVVALAFWLQLEADEGISRIFPLSLILFITAGAVWFVLKGIVRRLRAGEEAQIQKTGWRRVGIVALLSLLYALGIPNLGFFASTGTFLLVAFMALGDRDLPLSTKIIHGLTFAALFCLFIYVGFVHLLNVPVPRGILF